MIGAYHRSSVAYWHHYDHSKAMFESYLEELYRKQRAEAQAREEASLAETRDYINQINLRDPV
jgi:hypothetical protein